MVDSSRAVSAIGHLSFELDSDFVFRTWGLSAPMVGRFDLAGALPILAGYAEVL
jgi:hypothetical protein